MLCFVSFPSPGPAEQRFDERGLDARNSVGTAGDGSLAGLAVPDTGGVSSDGGLAAEGAGVLGVLGDFHLLHLLSQGGTVTVRGSSVSSWSSTLCPKRLRLSAILRSRSSPSKKRPRRRIPPLCVLGSFSCSRCVKGYPLYFSSNRTVGSGIADGRGARRWTLDRQLETHRTPYLPL